MTEEDKKDQQKIEEIGKTNLEIKKIIADLGKLQGDLNLDKPLNLQKEEGGNIKPPEPPKPPETQEKQQSEKGKEGEEDQKEKEKKDEGRQQ